MVDDGWDKRLVNFAPVSSHKNVNRCVVEVDALAPDTLLEDVISQRLQGSSIIGEAFSPSDLSSTATRLATDMVEDAAASLLDPAFASPWPMPFPYQSSCNQALPHTTASAADTNAVEVDDFVQRWANQLRPPPPPQPVSELPSVPPVPPSSSSSRAEDYMPPMPPPIPPSAPVPAPPPPPTAPAAPRMAPGCAASSATMSELGPIDFSERANVDVEVEEDEEGDAEDDANFIYNGPMKIQAPRVRSASDSTETVLRNALATITQTTELAKEINQELSPQRQALSGLSVPIKSKKGAMPRRTSRNLDDTDAQPRREDRNEVALRNLQPPPRRSAHPAADKNAAKDAKSVMMDSMAKVGATFILYFFDCLFDSEIKLEK